MPQDNELEDLLPPPTFTPDISMEDDEVESLEVDYSDRAPTDWVLSGPLGENGGGPGRRFANWDLAEAYVRKLHGKRFKRRITAAAAGNRWAFLIKQVVVN